MIELKTDAEIAAMTRKEMESYAVALFMELTPEERRELLAELREKYPEKKTAPVLEHRDGQKQNHNHMIPPSFYRAEEGEVKYENGRF